MISTDPLTLLRRGNALLDARDACGAEEAYRQALALLPRQGELYSNLGNALREQGRLEESVDAHRRAISLAPGYAVAYTNLGNALLDLGRVAEAEQEYRRCVELAPDYAPNHQNLGQLLCTTGRLDAAIACFRQAVALQPNLALCHLNLANALRDQGRHSDAIATYRRAVELAPENPAIHGALVYSMWFVESDPAPILAEHQRWFQRHAAPLMNRPHLTFDCDRSPDRPLRVGYVSPDFRAHAVGLSIEPVLAHHDPQRIEVTLYSGVTRGDEVTKRIGRYGRYVHTAGRSDEALAHRVRADKIDILVDLTSHMAGSRLLAFARRPAPLQVSYLAYPATTGLPAIDYRISTRHFESSEDVAGLKAEPVCFLPETYWCYAPTRGIAPPGPLPALSRGGVTFASTNNFAKTNPDTIRLWASILRLVPRSRLAVVINGGERGAAGIRSQFESLGIATDHLDLLDYQPRPAYLAQLSTFDILLDTYPCNGGTTTLDALWMGVPVVSLVGRTSVSRSGLSILSSLDLEHLAAQDPDHYVQNAVALASDLTALAALRASLRDRMEASPLMNAPRFTWHLEEAYRLMWRKWCQGI